MAVQALAKGGPETDRSMINVLYGLATAPGGFMSPESRRRVQLCSPVGSCRLWANACKQVRQPDNDSPLDFYADEEWRLLLCVPPSQSFHYFIRLLQTCCLQGGDRESEAACDDRAARHERGRSGKCDVVAGAAQHAGLSPLWLHNSRDGSS